MAISTPGLFSKTLRRLLAGMMTTMALSAGDLQAADSPRKPQRIVSMNLCTDDLVLRLAELRNIASVTYLARSWGASNVVERAKQVPINHGLAEEIIPFNPDLVLAGTYTTRTAVGVLRRTNVPLRELDVPNSIEGVRRQYLEYGEILGEVETAEKIVAGMDARLAKLDTDPPSFHPRAIVLDANGLTVGQGTLADEVMRRAGLENVAATLKIDNYGQIPLETIVTQGIEVLILSASRDAPPAMATEILKHPVFRRMSDRTRVVVMPMYLWACGGPTVVDAVELLRGIVNDMRPKAAGQ